MCLFYFIVFSLLFFGIKVAKRDVVYDDFMGKEQCNAIKGLFILMVFLSHCMLDVMGCGYGFDRLLDQWGLKVRSGFGQLIVVMFLFYSGFGVMESIKKKGEVYLKTFPRSRILTVLLNFDVAVFLFVLLDLALGINLKVGQILLSLVGWESVGNSNWYIFVILYCYLIAYLCFRLFHNPIEYRKGIFLVSVFAFVGMLVLSFFKQNWWYDTMLCFPLGMVFSYYKNRVVTFCRKRYWAVLAACLLLLFSLQSLKLPALHGLTNNVKSFVFVGTVVLLTMKIKTGNRVLIWLGVNLFPLYVYQRIPMIAIKSIAGPGWVCNYPYFFIGICFVVTLAITFGYRYWQIKL